jgi:streptogramin lyase
LQGAVYVANRAFGAQGTVTKIAGFPEDCVDRDGDGEITTSSDLNQNGYIDFDVPGEFVGQDDECILWTVDVGGRGGIPRALAVAADGKVWVGLHGESRVLALDPSDGNVVESVAVPGFSPYGAAIDSGGTLWLTAALSGQILSIDTATAKAGSVKTAPSPESGCPSSYGIAIDDRDRVWLAGFSCPYAFRYDPSDGSWFSQPIPDSGITRGIAADDLGNIYVAASLAYLDFTRDAVLGFIEASAPITRLTRFRADDGGDVRIWGSMDEPLAGAGAIGVGLDDQRRAWLVNQETGSATRVDTETGEVKHYTVGNGPYTYSDFTGFALRRITAPSGFIREVLEGCPMGPTEWERVTVDAKTPAGARVEIRVRSAARSDDLERASWLGPWNAREIDLLQAPGPLPEERFLELEARLVAADRSTSPSLREVVVQLHCPLWDWF